MLKKRRLVIKRILVLLLTLIIVFGEFANNKKIAEAATYKLTEEQLFMKAPGYLQSPEMDKYLKICEDACSDVMKDASDDTVAVAFEALSNGSSYIIRELASLVGVADGNFDKVNKDLAGEILKEYLQTKDYMEGVSTEISKAFSTLNKTYDLALSSEKDKLKAELKSLNHEYTDKEIDDVFANEELFSKILGTYNKTEDACKMFFAIIELNQMELAAIDDLMSLENIDSELYNGLWAIRKDITDDLPVYLLRTYGTDKLLKKIEKKVLSNTTGAVSGTATILVTLVIDVAATIYDRYNPSVKEITHAYLLEGYTRTADSAVMNLQMKFVKGTATADDIAKYKVAYNFYLTCLKKYMCACKKLTKSSKKVYHTLDVYADELGTSISYNTFLNLCLTKATNAINSGKLTIKNDSVVNKTDEGEVIDENYDPTESIQAKLQTIQSVYKPNVGQTWTKKYKGCYQCCGFALMVFNQLFDYDLCAYPYNARYKIADEKRAIKVGQLVGNQVTASNVKSMFANAKVGDFIQMDGGTYGQHSAIVVGVDDSGVTIYDCNSKLNGETTMCLIHQWKITWANWASWYGKPSSAGSNGISVYRAVNYASIYGDGANLFYDDTVNFVIEDGVLVKYNGWQSYVEIPDTVTAIGDSAFKNNTTMMNVFIPDTVTSIGASAFYGCTNLMGVNIPNSVETIGGSAFYNCTSLASVHLPENEQFIILNSYLFYNCKKIKALKIPNTITSMASNVFNSCESIENVDVPNEVTQIGISAFSNCNKLQQIILPNSLETIGEYAFDKCSSLQYVWIPKSLDRVYATYDSLYSPVGIFRECNNLNEVEFEEGITEIAYYLFANCPGITQINIPDTVTKIESGAFYNCKNLLQITIPNTVTSIGISAFSNCSKLQKIKLPNSLETIGEYAFDKCSSLQYVWIPKSLDRVYATYDSLYSPVGIFGECDNLNEVEFEEGITEIAYYLFANCPGITQINIPDTVTKIESGAFYNCKNLLQITIPNTVTSIGILTFSNCDSLKHIKLPSSLVIIGEDAFYRCNNLQSAWIPQKLERIYATYDNLYAPTGLFRECINLKSIEFEEGMTKICAYLFKECKGLEQIEIPSTVTNIGEHSFDGCTNISNVEIPDSVTKIEGSAFMNCKSMKQITIPDTVTDMGTSVFFGCTSLEKAHIPNIRINLMDYTFQNCTSLTEVNLPDTLETIGAGAFQNCTSLTEINLPSKVNTINSSAFSGCTGLTKVTIPESMRTINSNAFSHCEALTNLKIAEGTTKIYSNAFEYCTSLESVFLPDTLQELGSYAFRYCDKLSTVKIGAGLRVIPSYCFYEDPALEEIVLPQQVTTVNSYAFGNCTKFKDITMNRRVSAITANAFSYPDRLTIHGVSGTYAHTFANENGITFVSLNTPATAIHLNKTECQVGRGYTIQLTAGVTPENSSDELTWTSTDEDILTVDENGLVKGKKNGAASVVVMAGDVVEFCDVTVYEKVSSVYVNPSSKEMTIGENLQLTATVYPSDATNKNITWKSDDESIATVSAGGLVTAKAYGTAKITVTTEDGARTATVTISVKPIAVTGITLDKKAVTVGIDKTYQLKANILPENASIKDVTWTSSKPAVVTVENGLLTGVSEGTSIIIAKTVDGAKTASCTVTVKDLSVTGVSIPETSVEVPAGDVHLLKASIMPEDAYNKNVIWTCDDESVATVDAATGLVTGISEGTATMTVTTEDGGYTASCTVTVTAEPANITKVEAIVAEETDAELEEGEDITLSVTFMPADATNKNVIWISSDETVATVDENGKVTAIGAGDVVITAVSENGGKTATFEFTIKGTETEGQPTETPDNPNIDNPNEDDPDQQGGDNPNQPNEEQNPSGGQNPDASGSGQNPGNQQNPNGSGGQPDPSGGQQGENATQNIPVSKIAITGISKKITIDKKVALRADVLPANATNKGITWTSSNTQFATVSDKGVVTAKKKGIGKTVIITATAGDGSGVRADYKIAIVKHAVKSIKLSAKSNTVTAGKNLKLEATVKTTGKTANKTLIWSSSNKKYATVTNKGVVKTKKAGKGKTVKITAMATDGTGKKATIKIKMK